MSEPPPERPAEPPAYGQQPYAQPGYGQPFGPPSHGAPASMGKRLLARILDGVILGIPLTVLAAVIIGPTLSNVEVDADGQITRGADALVGAMLAVYGLYFAVYVLYEIVLIAVRGATLGKSILGIKVVKESDGSNPGLGGSILRWLIPVVGSLACGIGWLLVILSPFWDSTRRNQGWQDKVAKTLVVQR